MICENLQAKDPQAMTQNAVQLSLECKATVGLGDDSRGGTTRGDVQAGDHDRGVKDKGILCGMVDEGRLLYFPPHHSQYNPIERCWGMLEQHGNGTRLTDVETMLAWAQSMTWKSHHSTIRLNTATDEKGIALTKQERGTLKTDRNAIRCYRSTTF